MDFITIDTATALKFIMFILAVIAALIIYIWKTTFRNIERTNEELGKAINSLNKTTDSLNETINRLDKKHEGLEKRHDGLEKRHDSLERTIKERHDGLEKTVEKTTDKLDKKHDSLEKKHDGLVQTIESVRQELRDLKDSLNAFKNSLNIFLERHFGHSLLNSKSPLSLSDYGEASAEAINAEQIVKLFIDHAVENTVGMNAYNVQEYCFDYASTKMLEIIEQKHPEHYEALTEYAYKESMKLKKLSEVLGLLLRDAVLERSGKESSAKEKSGRNHSIPSRTNQIKNSKTKEVY